jgi:hypothetical protein
MNEKDEEYPINYIYQKLNKELIFPRPLFMNYHIPHLPKENDKGNKEYKYRLYLHDDLHNYPLRIQDGYIKGEEIKYYKCEKKEWKKKEKTASQMLYRLLEGNGKAIYIIGVHDDGENIGINLKETFESIHFLIDSSKIIQATVKSIKIYQGKRGYITTIRLHLSIDLNYNITLF